MTASQAVPQIFWGGFNTLTGHSGASTIAAWTPESGFSIGSYLATVNTQQTAVLNVLLSTLGTSASVTALGYQGLANTYVSVNQLITASGGLLTTSNVMTTPLPANDWQTIWSDAVANQLAQTNCTSSPLLCNASTALSSGLSFSGGVTTEVQLCQLVSVNGSSCSNGNLSTYALNANLNALQTLTTEAEVTNGSNALNVTSALSITGVTAATLSLSLVQPPQVAYGPVGSSTSASPCPVTAPATSTCATTAQVSSDLQLTVAGQVLDIPLSAAVGYATLSQVVVLQQRVPECEDQRLNDGRHRRRDPGRRQHRDLDDQRRVQQGAGRSARCRRRLPVSVSARTRGASARRPRCSPTPASVRSARLHPAHL